MKRFLCLMCMVLMLAGCTDPFNNLASTETFTEVTEDVTEASLPDLLDGSTNASEDQPVVRLCNDAVSGLVFFGDSSIFQDSLLILDSPDGYPDPNGIDPVSVRILLIDLKTGEVNASRDLETAEEPMIQVCGDRLFLIAGASGQLTVLDDHLETVREYRDPDTTPTLLYGDSTGASFYRIPASGALEHVDLETGETVTLVAHSASMTVTDAREDGLCITCLDDETYRYHNYFLDFASDSLTEVPLPGGFEYFQHKGDLWLARLDAWHGLYLLGNGEDSWCLQSDDHSFSLIDGPAPICSSYIATSGENSSYTLYRPDGRVYASVEFPAEMGWPGLPVWSNRRNGYFITMSNDQQKPYLLFWSPKAAHEGSSLEMQKISELVPDLGTVPQDLYERAARISDTYHVEILIGPQCGTEYNGFYAEQQTDPSTISAGLDAVESVLQCYPEGFMDQLLYGQFRRIQINLMGTLSAADIPEDADGFTDFDAFVDHPDCRHAMVIDITHPGLIQTMYHEFSHIIDSKLDFESWYRDSLYSDDSWCALNPPDFQYAENVFNLNEYSQSSAYDSYFIDTYARTYSTEDRARTMEYAMIGYDWYFDSAYHGPLREKLAYYSACIRDSFDTEGWPDTLPWEVPLYGYVYQPEQEAA